LSIADFAEALKGRSELEITVKGRRTGRKRSTTIWFVVQGGKIYLLPVSGSDTDWYKNVLKDPHIRLAVGKRSVETEVRSMSEPGAVKRVVELFAKKYGGMSEIKRWYSKLDVAVEVSLA